MLSLFCECKMKVNITKISKKIWNCSKSICCISFNICFSFSSAIHESLNIERAHYTILTKIALKFFSKKLKIHILYWIEPKKTRLARNLTIKKAPFLLHITNLLRNLLSGIFWIIFFFFLNFVSEVLPSDP